MANSIFSRYKETIQNKLSLDDKTIDTLEGEFDCSRPLSFIHKHVFWFYLILSIVSNFIYKLWGLKSSLSKKDFDFLFFSCPDEIFRTKSITQIADGLNYCLIYLPNMHIKAALKYYSFFKNKKITTVFPAIYIKDVLEARRLFQDISKSIRDKKDSDYLRLKYTVFIYILYDRVACRILSDIGGFGGKCIMEHQKFYFMPVVANLRKNGINTTMMQHGLFYTPVFDYVPLFCDNVLCCSEREKAIYIENGTDEQKVTVLGAPLQTLSSEILDSSTRTKYSLLLLMTEIFDDNLDITREILNYIKGNYTGVLVRMRPRSRKEDIKRLGNALSGLIVSSTKSSLVKDINNAAKVVSFSVDANVEVAKQHKPLVYVWTEGTEEDVRDTQFATRQNYKEEIYKLMSEEFYSTFSEEQYKMILGETDINVLRQKFVHYIKD